FSGRFLNFYSWHPLIIGMIDRVLLLSHPSFHQKNFDLVIRILLNNGYPLHLTLSTIKKRLYMKFDIFNNKDNNDTNSETVKKRNNSPHFGGLWESLMKDHAETWSISMKRGNKWTDNGPKFQLGAMILIKNKSLPCTQWLLGRITALHQSEDEIARVATIKTATDEINRSIRLLCPLPVES
ncbi:hypothetical protein ALC62_05861, partial [Cyphomyrmex costatus]